MTFVSGSPLGTSDGASSVFVSTTGTAIEILRFSEIFLAGCGVTGDVEDDGDFKISSCVESKSDFSSSRSSSYEEKRASLWLSMLHFRQQTYPQQVILIQLAAAFWNVGLEPLDEFLFVTGAR